MGYYGVNQVTRPQSKLMIVRHEEKVSALSRPFYDSHTNATGLYNGYTDALSSEDREMTREVKWARVDYNTEWRTCTRWLIFR